MQPVPPQIQVSLEDYVNENKKYLAWVPTEPKFLITCWPTSEPGMEGAIGFASQGKPQGFMAAFDDIDDPFTPDSALMSSWSGTMNII